MDKKVNQVLIITFITLFVVIHSPILHIFNRLNFSWTIPPLILFLSGFWILVIVILWYIATRFLKDKDHGN
ncbi:hypothetical protein [Fulvivirga sp.]|uniref:hypothetical protein n=1 Tax=Fulvivirga sp. TaxID=1931237 RepID=UPI0032EAEEF8